MNCSQLLKNRAGCNGEQDARKRATMTTVTGTSRSKQSNTKQRSHPVLSSYSIPSHLLGGYHQEWLVARGEMMHAGGALLLRSSAV